jgi:ribosomal protein L32
MSVRMRHTRAHTANRRSHHALSEPAVSNDAKDGAHLRHRVSPITGKYKGEQVLDTVEKVSKKAQQKAETKAEAKKEEPKAEAKKQTKKKSTEKDEK